MCDITKVGYEGICIPIAVVNPLDHMSVAASSVEKLSLAVA
jgi:hypothetical protein